MWPFKKKPEPKVGMILYDKDWGLGFTDLEVTAVSINKKQFQYKFLCINGKSIQNSSLYTGSWLFMLESYIIKELTQS